MRRLFVMTCLIIGSLFALPTLAGADSQGDVSSTDAATVLAGIGISPAAFEATSNGVSLAQFQQQLAALHSGQPIPSFPRPLTEAAQPVTEIIDGPSGAPQTQGSAPPASAAQATYTCQAFGSREFTLVINTLGLIGYGGAGFLERCTQPKKTIVSSCAITLKVGRRSNHKTDHKGGNNCSASTAVGPSRRGATGTMSANWGAHNKLGNFGHLGSGCVIDGANAICTYKSPYRMGINDRFGWVPG